MVIAPRLLRLCPRRKEKREFRALDRTFEGRGPGKRQQFYRHLIGGLNESGIILSREILSAIAADEPKVFDAIMAAIKK